MAKPDLSELKDLIPTRAIEVLEEHGASLDELADYDLAQLQAIKGIGPKWANDILESLSLLRTTEPPTADESLVPGYFESLDDESLSDLESTVDNDATTAIEPEHTDPPDFATPNETPLGMALRYLRECGRDVDADDVQVLAQSDEMLAVSRAIDILEGLPGGALPSNLAQDVREQAGLPKPAH